MAGLQTDLVADLPTGLISMWSDHEYRGRPLPLWRVFNSGSSLVAYVDAYSGGHCDQKRAWRWWDFLGAYISWTTTIDDIGTVLLKIFSVLAVLTAAGIALYFLIPRKIG